MLPFYHRPVMLDEVIAGLAIKPNGVYFDGTVGGGGHSFAILESDPTVRLIAGSTVCYWTSEFPLIRSTTKREGFRTGRHPHRST